MPCPYGDFSTFHYDNTIHVLCNHYTAYNKTYVLVKFEYSNVAMENKKAHGIVRLSSLERR